LAPRKAPLRTILADRGRGRHGLPRQAVTATGSRTAFCKSLVCISPSIGIAAFPGDGDDAETLLWAADQAMYCAKTQGGGRYSHFRWRATSNGATLAQNVA